MFFLYTNSIKLHILWICHVNWNKQRVIINPLFIRKRNSFQSKAYLCYFNINKDPHAVSHEFLIPVCNTLLSEYGQLLHK